MEQIDAFQTRDQKISRVSGGVLETDFEPQYRAIIFLGPPGCGKGTQSRRLSAALQIPVISTGDILRENIRLGTELGIRARRAVECGELVADEWIFEMLEHRLSDADCERGFILDGVPRTPQQVHFLTSQLCLNDGKAVPFLVIRLEIDDQKSLKRMHGRRVCPFCGATFNLETNPPAAENECDFDGMTLIQRSDDSQETFGKRLAEYRQTAETVQAQLSLSRFRTFEVNCDAPIEEISSLLLGIISQSSSKHKLEYK